ncbi:MAG: o-succinylbenzoate synthase [Akkermansia sp.]
MKSILQQIAPEHMPPFKLSIQQHELKFKNRIKTSRGCLDTMNCYLVHCEHEQGHGVGECCPMPFYSPEYHEHMLADLQKACAMVEAKGGLDAGDFPRQSSIRFALEGALLSSLHEPIWDNAYTRGEVGIPLHHLIWMDSTEGMRTQITRGINAGYHCIKMKTSPETWATDLQLLREARELNPMVELRVDANGSFSPNDAAERLEELASIGISCIEQPIAPHQWEEMAKLVAQSPVRIALDEELINCHSYEQRELMICNIKPHALVIKPSLHGGLQAAVEYAKLARQHKMACWLNSSLESNIGLNILAQFAGQYMPERIHALGTGHLYQQNFNTPTQLIDKELRYID